MYFEILKKHFIFRSLGDRNNTIKQQAESGILI